MSTDTAFALGLLALVGPRFPDRLRAFMLTVVVVDDIVALVVIATVYTETLDVAPLLVAIALLRRSSSSRARCRIRIGPRLRVLGAGRLGGAARSRASSRSSSGSRWACSPTPTRRRASDLERATERFREFREQPTAELARGRGPELRSAISPNERLQQLFHPWTSYVIVPLFALANAGIAIDGDFLGRAFTSPITLGILFGYVVGKPVGIVGRLVAASRGSAAAGCARRSAGRPSPAAAPSPGSASPSSLLIATLAFDGRRLEEAKLGILSAAVAAALDHLAAVPRDGPAPAAARSARCSAPRSRSSTCTATSIPSATTSAARVDAPVTVVEYGDFECPYCGQAEPVVRELLADFGDVRYVWRHLPLTDVHPHAQLAAEAAEAAADQGAFWEMHDLLLGHQDALEPSDLIALRRAARPRRRALRPTTCASTPAPAAWPRTSTAPT